MFCLEQELELDKEKHEHTLKKWVCFWLFNVSLETDGLYMGKKTSRNCQPCFCVCCACMLMMNRCISILSSESLCTSGEAAACFEAPGEAVCGKNSQGHCQ